MTAPTEMERRVADAYQAVYYAGGSHMESIRAAIRAMREPTDEMVQPHLNKALCEFTVNSRLTAGVYRAMIDAASPPTDDTQPPDPRP